MAIHVEFWDAYRPFYLWFVYFTGLSWVSEIWAAGFSMFSRRNFASLDVAACCERSLAP